MTLNPFDNSRLHGLELADLVVIRGSIIATEGPGVDILQLVRDTHQPNIALRLIKGYIFQDSADGVTADVAIACKLTTMETGQDSFDCGDFQQIAWITGGRATPQVGQKDYNDIIDPTNLVTHELFGEFWTEGNTDTVVNYMFIFQRVELDDTQALVATLTDYIS